MKSIHIAFFALLSIMLNILFIQNAEAQTTPLTVTPVYPENQNPETKGYFNLNVKPNATQTVYMELQNNTNKPLPVKIQLADSYTKPSGGIMYDKELDTPLSTLLKEHILVDTYLNMQDEVTIEPNSKTRIPLEISVPNIKKGNVVGGIRFITKGEESDLPTEQGEANFIVKTETVFALGVQLNFPEKETSNIQWGDVQFFSETGELQLNLTNNAQMIQENISGAFTLINENQEQLFETEIEPFKMAPYTSIKFPIKWEGSTLTDGGYTLKVNANINGEIVKTERYFEIDQEEIEEYVQENQDEVNIEVDKSIPSWIWIIAAVAFGLLMFFIGRRKNK